MAVWKTTKNLLQKPCEDKELIDVILEKVKFEGPMDSEKIKFKKEYFAKAILLSCWPEKYQGIQKSEGPDLFDSENNLGVEVTTVTLQKSKAIEGDFAKYCRMQGVPKEEKEERIKAKGGTLLKTPVARISYGGGYNGCEKELKRIIEKKREKSKQYANDRNIKTLELFIEFEDPCFIDYDRIPEWIIESEREGEIYSRYFLFYRAINKLCWLKDGKKKEKTFRKEYIMKLDKLARAIVERRIDSADLL